MKKKVVIDAYKCPECGYPQFCPCPTCISRVPDGHKPWIWHLNGEVISCTNCGLTMHVDRWMSVEEEFVKDKRFVCKHKEDD